MELRASAVYSARENWLSWWRTSGGVEVDFILGGEIAVEVKATDTPANHHIKGLREHRGEFKPRRSILVCRAPRIRIRLHHRP
jgi:predicted AAA+ superfamily ATPase